MTASLPGLSSQTLRQVRFPPNLTLHLHYIKSSLKRTSKTTVYLMHPKPNTCAVTLLIAKGCRDSQAGRRRFKPGQAQGDVKATLNARATKIREDYEHAVTNQKHLLARAFERNGDGTGALTKIGLAVAPARRIEAPAFHSVDACFS
jgi:hypothetical protein